MNTKILFKTATLFFVASLIFAGCGGSTGNGNKTNVSNQKNSSDGNRKSNGNSNSVNTNNSTDPNSPTAAIRNYHRYGENNDAKAMCNLYSSANLEKNRKSLEEGCRYFADPKKRAESFGDNPSLSELEEIYVGEKAIVKGFYGTKEGNRRGAVFQARLIKENGEWKIERTSANAYEDLTKE